MKKHKGILIVMIIACLIILLAPAAALAAGADAGDIPKEGVIYTLTYPDGTELEVNEDGEKLSYEDVMRLLEEENWRLMAEGLESDEKGEALLDPSLKKGTVRIVETEVPEGYVKGDVNEKTVKLEEGVTTFINPKESPAPEPPAPRYYHKTP